MKQNVSIMKKYVLASNKKWHKSLFQEHLCQSGENWVYVSTPSELTAALEDPAAPEYIFFTHWSEFIPKGIYQSHTCVLFHMTDVPFGRGGSPLQNLIVRGFTETKLSALRVTEVVDGGDVFLKRPLSLSGSAQEILERAALLMVEMIREIIESHPTAQPQVGTPEIFRRRRPEDGDLSVLTSAQMVYDYIRMLDATDYPPAFLETEHFRFEFHSAKIEDNNTVTAHVKIVTK